jgi:hypothetical protein
MKQVFIANGIPLQAHGDAYNAGVRTVGGSAAVEDIGIWSLQEADWLNGAGTDDLIVLATGVWNAAAGKGFQVVSAQTTGNPIASPIIYPKDVTRIAYHPSAAPVKHVAQLDDVWAAAVAVGDAVQLKISIRFPAEIAFYEAQVNPSEGVTGAAISAAFDNPQKVWSVEVTSASTLAAGDDASALTTLLAAAVVANSAVSKFITATADTDNLVLTANLYGMVIDATISVDGVAAGATFSQTAMSLGVGSYYEALSEEKKALYTQGNFNRMYLPTGGETYASKTAGATGTVTDAYDRLTIEYNSSTNDMPGFNGAGVGNQAVIYFPAVAAASGTGATWEACFGIVIDVAQENNNL